MAIRSLSGCGAAATTTALLACLLLSTALLSAAPTAAAKPQPPAPEQPADEDPLVVTEPTTATIPGSSKVTMPVDPSSSKAGAKAAATKPAGTAKPTASKEGSLNATIAANSTRQAGGKNATKAGMPASSGNGTTGINNSTTTRGSSSSGSSGTSLSQQYPEYSKLAKGSWRQAKSTWYGTPQPFVSYFAPTRGGGVDAFGILEWGACGYTNSYDGQGVVPFPKEAVAAYSDANEDSAGACGRCYEVRCKEGLLLGWDDQPIPIGETYYPPAHASAPDSFGRQFPGNPAEKDGQIYVKCWDKQKSVKVKIIDICPCYYCPEIGPKAGQCYYQESCCNKNYKHPRAGQPQFDLTYWAYEQLAHPMFQEMMLEYRPVDCGSGQPLEWAPGVISKQPYHDGTLGEGWTWFVQKEQRTPQDFQIILEKEGASGNAAACTTVLPDGGMTFWCRQCDQRPAGSMPFDGIKGIQIRIKSKTKPGDVPPASINLYQFSGSSQWLTAAGIQKAAPSKFCDNPVSLKGRQPSSRQGDYATYDIPLEEFRCRGDVHPNKVDVLLDGSGGNYRFCVDLVKLW